ncbi:MAG TPA: hypothetical protein VF062_22365 [Candidatus Limnocylindrales bacterium]
MLVLRSERRATAELGRIVGPWPGKASVRHATASGRLRTGSPAWMHAKQVWTGTVAKVGRGRVEGREDLALSLAFVEAVADHAGSCRKCAKAGTLDQISAGEWLLWALAYVPATRQVMTPILRELAGQVVPPQGLPLPGR